MRVWCFDLAILLPCGPLLSFTAERDSRTLDTSGSFVDVPALQPVMAPGCAIRVARESAPFSKGFIQRVLRHVLIHLCKSE